MIEMTSPFVQFCKGERQIGGNLRLFPRMKDRFKRVAADHEKLEKTGLAWTKTAPRLGLVVAGLPQGPGTNCLNRYPSPYGRRRVFWRASPIFSSAEAHRDGQTLASLCMQKGELFDAAAVSTCDRGITPEGSGRGSLSCRKSFHWPQPWLPRLALRPVATHWASRPLSGRARASAPRRCWAAALQPGQPSVRRATSPIATPTQADADHLTGGAARRRACHCHRAIDGAAVGGFFFADRKPEDGRGRTEGDAECSRKS